MKFQKAISVLSGSLLLCMVFCPLALFADNSVPVAASCHGESHPEQEEGQSQALQCCVERAIAVSEMQVSPHSVEASCLVAMVSVPEVVRSPEPSPRYTETGRFLASVSVLRI